MDDQTELLIDLRSLRTEAGVSSMQVVETTGVSKATYLRIEVGGTPNLTNALKISRYLQMPVEEIWALKK